MAIHETPGELYAFLKKDQLLTIITSLAPFQYPEIGEVATTPAAKLYILSNHCQKVYNHNDVPVTFTVLYNVETCEVQLTLSNPSSMKEMLAAVQKMANNKAPSTSEC